MTALALDFRAFARSRKIKSPQQLLRVVLLYCGVDQSLREVASTMTLLDERITDTAICKRLRACQAWVKAALPLVLGSSSSGLEEIAEERRFLVVDATHVESPGAKGTQYRLHLSLNLKTLEFVELLVTDAATGEKLKNFRFSAGDVVIADCGYAGLDSIAQTSGSGSGGGGALLGQQFPALHPFGRKD